MPRLILIVDDSEEICTTLAETFSDEGFETVSCQNGRDALDYLHDGRRPDLILLDLVMPIMDGAQFRRRQLEDPALAPIPVLLMTSLRAFDEKSLGLTGKVLLKPFAVKAVLEAIRAALL